MTATRELVNEISLALQFAHICVFWNILEKIGESSEIRRKRAAPKKNYGGEVEGSQTVT